MREYLRRTFGEDAELYDRVRPGYPEALFADLASFAELGPGTRILEIGCGTGQATLPLAERGCAITAIELSAGLAAIATEKLRPFSQVQVITVAFEQWPLPDQPFDLLVAAQALHWIDPAIRFQKVAAALRPGGGAAVFGHRHVAGGSGQFFIDVQTCYERHMPGTPVGLRLQEIDELPFDDDGLAVSGLFQAPIQRRYPWVAEYTASEYLDVLSTYSGHRALDPIQRRQLFDCITSLIDREGGRIRKAYLTELAFARKAEGERERERERLDRV
jgi:SAM-dependent methyltransferase